MRTNKGYVVEAGRIFGTVLLCLAFMSGNAVAARKTYYFTRADCTGSIYAPCGASVEAGVYLANTTMICNSRGDLVLPANITSLTVKYLTGYIGTPSYPGTLYFNGSYVTQHGNVNTSCVPPPMITVGLSPNLYISTGGFNSFALVNSIINFYSAIAFQSVPGYTNVMFVLEMDYTPVVLSTPSHGGFTNSLTPAISWAALTGSTSYQLQIDGTPFFNSGALMDKTITGSVLNYTLNGTPPELLTNADTYYARFKALGGTYNNVWSLTTSFTVDTSSPSAPTPNQPAADSTIPTQTPLFNWSPVTSGSE